MSGLFSCATDGCDNPECGPCTVPRRFAHVIEAQRRLKDTDGLRDNAPALNGTEPRPSRDPWFIKRTRKALVGR